MYTEEEAKKKWCPDAKIGINRPWVGDHLTDECNCVASGCMAWQKNPNARIDPLIHKEDLSKELSAKIFEKYERDSNVGYCTRVNNS